jgi:peptidoglycan/xylan/chitin deacetylase (PgdA/CDA1 family)
VPFRVALTFDAEHPDRPTRSDPQAVLDQLDRSAVRASFFLQGRWVEAYPRLARRVADAGHLIGNHSHYHARMPLLTAAGLRSDVRAAESVIRRRAGVDPRPWLRLPFGNGEGDQLLAARLDDLGYRHIGWDVDVAEWRARQSARRVADGIVEGVLAHGDGAIVLLHTWPDPVPGALAQLVPRLRDAGVTFVRLDELAA